ncbi:hypothetical protein D9758_006751 [Tetrapyrgos nigripes]|uniref:Cytochrome P450 n=1 Tax=Tetrapyrgos nigripes TaxID=182062 RepID=A0A8H5FU12_9AGAR|nr:hypothetical protein D9758_006751 [Tetrapyrgos nigripes]
MVQVTYSRMFYTILIEVHPLNGAPLSSTNMYSYPTILLTSLSAWVLTIIAYRLLFSPLRKFPGPLLAAVTYFYEGYFDLVGNGSFLSHIEHLHAQYGPVIRVGPNTLHFSNPEAYADIYTQGTFNKSRRLYDCFFHAYESSVAFLEPEKSRLRRNLLNPLFSRRAILNLRHVIQAKVDRFVLLMKNHPDGGPIDFSLAIRALTMEVITSYCFASSYAPLEYPDFRHPLVVGNLQFINNFSSMKWLLPLFRLGLAIPHSIIKRANNPVLTAYIEMKQDFEDRIERYLQDESTLENEEHETIFHHLILPQTKEGINRSLRPSKKSLIDEAFMLIGAGSDTVANACGIGLVHALSDVSIGRKLKEELRQAWPDEDSPLELHLLEQLPYLTAFIKEALRTSYGVVTPLPRVVGPSGATIGGVHIPGGTDVQMSSVFLHDNPTVFQDPKTFSPERWLVSDTRIMESYLVPFSKGPRMCLGINLAWCELYLILGNIFRRLDLTLYDTTVEDFKNFKDTFVPAWSKHIKVTVNPS